MMLHEVPNIPVNGGAALRVAAVNLFNIVAMRPANYTSFDMYGMWKHLVHAYDDDNIRDIPFYELGIPDIRPLIIRVLSNVRLTNNRQTEDSWDEFAYFFQEASDKLLFPSQPEPETPVTPPAEKQAALGVNGYE